ncbi:hypothetical protein MMC06_004686 [Schaereria dolodes]|nr:hypothetical protein [Schaereria dolodes]
MGQLGGLSPQGSVVVGIIVGLLSTSVQSLGLTLQRKSHILEDEKDIQDGRRPPYRRRRWQLGMLMFVVSNLLGSTIQITTLPLPVLSTLQASGLVFNSICATLILGEPFTRWSLGGTILVCGGAILIAIFGAIGEPAHSLDQLLALLGRRQFVIWMICQAVLVLAIISGARSLKYVTLWISNSPRMKLFRGMAYGCISGILSAHSLLVAKSAVELLVRTIVDRKNQFNRWQSWIILLGLLALALSQLYYLHRGLKLCSTSILYPFVFCVYNIIAILDGLIYFHQTSRLSLLHALLIALGTLILLTGVLALSWRLNNDPVTRPAVVQTPLTSGMSSAPEDSDSEAETTFQTTPHGDEESLTLDHSPLLNGNGKGSGKHRDWHTPTPTTKDNDLLSVTRNRRKGMTEADEIWGELEDETPELLSPFSRRRSSARSTPSRLRSSGTLDGVGEPNEGTALLARSGTGRSYRDTRWWRSVPEGDPRAWRKGSQAQGQGQTQEALGGWWKMRWWTGSKGDKDGRREGSARDERAT